MSAPPNGHDHGREASHADYEELRAHVPLARPASLDPNFDAPADEAPAKVSVMEWLVGVGREVVRRFRGTRVPPAPMARIHGR